MEKILFKINPFDNSPSEDTGDITVIPLNTMEEIFSTPYFQKNKNSIIHLTIDSKEQLDNILFTKVLDKINLPIVFLLRTSESICIENLLHLHYTNIFTAEQPTFVTSKYIEYMFKNYHSFVTQNTNSFLKSFDHKSLTKKELEILKVIAESPRRELHRDQIYIKIWGAKEFNTNTLDVHLCNLRRKLKNSVVKLGSTDNGKVAINL